MVAIYDHLAKLKYSSTWPYVHRAMRDHGGGGVEYAAGGRGECVVRAFVRPRVSLVLNAELARKLEHKLELQEGKLTTHDEALVAVLSAIRELMAPPEQEEPKKRQIGFVTDD